ncbi:MAG: hypothetical protein Q9P01_04595 [Anaerolineae bacterium]|nr:hypothetical protein [Anaerolineae bacterium]MDQ7034120.1 hypothetical protein [Anaerolineae bacterium]
MSKRRNKKPNLPEDVLARARKQAGIEEPETDSENDENGDKGTNGNGEKVSVNERAARRRKLSPVQLERSRKRGDLDGDTIRDMLENPTIAVSEEQLREEYQHVLVDLRNMGVLAAGLMVLLVVLAQFI